MQQHHPPDEGTLPASSVPLGVRYPELRPLCDMSGHLWRPAIEEKFARPPGTLSLPDIEALEMVLILAEDLSEADAEIRSEADALLSAAPWLREVSFEPEWIDEFFGNVLGQTLTRERMYNGEVVERTVKRHPGRADVR